MIIVIADTYLQARHFAETTGLNFLKHVSYVNHRDRIRGYDPKTVVVVFGALNSSEVQKAYEDALVRFDIVMRVTDIG